MKQQNFVVKDWVHDSKVRLIVLLFVVGVAVCLWNFEDYGNDAKGEMTKLERNDMSGMISMMNAATLRNGSVISKKREKEERIFLTFLDDRNVESVKKYQSLSNSLINDSMKIGNFEKAIQYRYSQLPNYFKKRIKDFVSQDGLAYWSWKPFIILNVLTSEKYSNIVKFNDIVCYLDSKYQIVKNWDAIFYAIENDLEIPFLTFWNKPNTPQWEWSQFLTKDRDWFILNLNKNDNYLKNMTDVWAGCICLKKNELVIQLISEWLAYCLDFRLISHKSNDQWILAAILYKWNLIDTNVKTFPPVTIGPLQNIRAPILQSSLPKSRYKYHYYPSNQYHWYTKYLNHT